MNNNNKKTNIYSLGIETLIPAVLSPRIRPSMSCGPFRFFPFMWAIVPNFFSSLSLSSQEFLFFIGSQAFSIPLFLLFR